MSIASNIKSFEDILSTYGCQLVAVSKKKPNEDILEAYGAGHRNFGENQVQELSKKASELPTDINWHMIGHLQRNKVKYLAPFVAMIHAMDSERLLKEIEKQAAKADRTIPCLLQVHIAEEETKFGFNEEELINLLKSDLVAGLTNVKLAGLMGMATNTPDKEKVRKEFRGLKELFESIKDMDLPDSVNMQELSIGMTSDYEIALEEGSTIVRIGSAIFGPRV
jgi:pyridoxal phosphate enzyme (YggS family)